LRWRLRLCLRPRPVTPVPAADVGFNLTAFVTDFVKEPTTVPWGNRSPLFRDPDGNLVNFFTPVTPAAIQKFAPRRPVS
jgi:hypothetical protein